MSPFLLSLIVSAIMIVVPSAVLRTLLGLRCLMRAESFESSDDSTEDYYNAQYLWSKAQKYHKDHFLYKNLSEKVNPEFLTAGADTGSQLEALKGAYGSAKADDAETGGSGVALKGGKIIGGDSGILKPTTYGASAASDAPTTYGVGTAASTGLTYGVSAPSTSPPDDVPTPEEPTPTTMTPPTPVVPTRIAPTGPTPHRPTPKGPVWEYEGGHGFQAFADDCQQFLENKYQEFVSGGKGGGKGKGKGKHPERVNVRTSGTTISVDLDKMTSKVQDSHKIRNIRRQEG